MPFILHPPGALITPCEHFTGPRYSTHPSASSPWKLNKGVQNSLYILPYTGKAGEEDLGLQYIDMWKLLPENISLLLHMEALNSPTAHPHIAAGARPRLGEANSLLSRAICFSTYIAVSSEAHPSLVKFRLAYLTLIMSKARRNCADCWISYDSTFRQNTAEDECADWTHFDTSLHTATLWHRVLGPGLLPILFG